MTTESSLSRVLLIAPRFFNYEHEIAAELNRSGQEVDLLPEHPFNSPLMKAVLRFRPELGGHRACDRFFAQRMEELGRNNYSTILVIKGEGVTSNTLRNLRKAYPRARLVFYAWDSIENTPFSERNLSFYDRCSTFDPVDAKKYGMSFRPLFYTDERNYPTDTTYKYDLSFIGTVHSDRYRIVQTLLEQLPADTRTFIYLYLQAPWMFAFRRIFTNTVKGAKREDFRFLPLSKEMVKATFFGSRAVLDIEHPNQRGATMRTMEALGSNRKLVSTNGNLRYYDFYNPRNIQIIDRKAPRLRKDFLISPYEPVPEEIRKKHSIHQWLRDVLGCGHQQAYTFP
jgi:hypothetical protein